jgi:D-aminoacyl-tRNA deacylase
MRAVVQRVSQASVTVDGETTGSIGCGMLIFLGVCNSDSEDDAAKLADKIYNLRFFNDGSGKMNLSCADTDGQILVISQFTLYGDCRKGRRPSYSDAAGPETAKPLYESFVAALRREDVKVATGVFGAMMNVSLINDGPVTLIVEV